MGGVMNSQDIRASVREMASILIRLETHDIRPQNPVENLVPERQSIEEFFRRKRGMQEPANLDVDVHLLCSLSKQERE
jgi:7,8-dihydro-6-hydroxymethylpterin-pyrophosphokinase